MSSPIIRIAELTQERLQVQRDLAQTQREQGDVVLASQTLEAVRLEIEHLHEKLHSLYELAISKSNVARVITLMADLVDTAKETAKSLQKPEEEQPALEKAGWDLETIQSHTASALTALTLANKALEAQLESVNKHCIIMLSSTIAASLAISVREQMATIMAHCERREFILALALLQAVTQEYQTFYENVFYNIPSDSQWNKPNCCAKMITHLDKLGKSISLPNQVSVKMIDPSELRKTLLDQFIAINKHQQQLHHVKKQLEDEEAACRKALIEVPTIDLKELTTQVAPNAAHYVNHFNQKDATTLMHLAVRAKRYDIVRWLVTLGAKAQGSRQCPYPAHLALQVDPDISLTHFSEVAGEIAPYINLQLYFDENTLLHLAVLANRADIITWLYERGAKNTRNWRGNYPLTLALLANPVTLIEPKLLEGLGTSEVYFALKRCLSDNPHVEIRVLQAYFGPDIIKYINILSILHAAVGTGRDDLVLWALEQGATNDSRDESNQFAFYYAGETLSTDVVTRLLPSKRVDDLPTHLRNKCKADMSQKRGTHLSLWIGHLILLNEAPKLMSWLVVRPDLAEMIPAYCKGLQAAGQRGQELMEEEANLFFANDSDQHFRSTFSKCNKTHHFAPVAQYGVSVKEGRTVYEYEHGFSQFTLLELALLYGNVGAVRHLASLALPPATRLTEKYNSHEQNAQRAGLVFNFIVHRGKNTLPDENDWLNATRLIDCKSTLVPQAVLDRARIEKYAAFFALLPNYGDALPELTTLKKLIHRLTFTYFVRASLHKGHGEEGYQRALDFFTRAMVAQSLSQLWAQVASTLVAPQSSLDRYSFKYLLSKALVLENPEVNSRVFKKHNPFRENDLRYYLDRAEVKQSDLITLGLLIKMRLLPSLEVPQQLPEDDLFSRLKQVFNEGTYSYLLRNAENGLVSHDGVKKAHHNWQDLSEKQSLKSWLSMLTGDFFKGNTLRSTSHRACVVDAILNNKALCAELGIPEFQSKAKANDDSMREAKLKFVVKQLEVYGKGLAVEAAPAAETRVEVVSSVPQSDTPKKGFFGFFGKKDKETSAPVAAVASKPADNSLKTGNETEMDELEQTGRRLSHSGSNDEGL
jgi:hypothetical protein